MDHRVSVASSPGEVTQLLQRFQAGDRDAASRLMALIYPELKRLARAKLKREWQPHDLQPTALVHETYLRLVGHTRRSWESRAHFFAAAANVMRRILVEQARARNAQKRTGGAVPGDERFEVPDGPPEDLIDLDQALTELERLSSRQARVVELRYFAGLSVPEIATALGVNPRSVDRDWATARAWLRQRLQS